jgi:hypothetical protein
MNPLKAIATRENGQYGGKPRKQKSDGETHASKKAR